MLVYTLLLTTLSFLYAGVLLRLRHGLSKLASGISPKQPCLSVVIAARNEERHLPGCLSAILKQRYPKGKLEIIVVDDRSEDRTAQIVSALSQKHGQIKLLQIRDRRPHVAPKKRAIELGVRNASGEIIVTTDADCEPGPFWLAELVKYFEPAVGLVAGFNPYKIKNERSFFHQMLALDYSAMACVAAATAALDYPISCSGGNLAYRKQVYFAVGGFEGIGRWISGDDDFFLQQVRSKTSWKIRYASDPRTFVPTQPPATVMEFVHQRIRYASKGRHYSLPVSTSLLGVYLLNLLLVAGFASAFFAPSRLLFWSGIFLTKSAAECLFLKRGTRAFHFKLRLLPFLITAALHPLYLVLAGLFGQFATFKWKGEKYSAKIKGEEKLEKIVGGAQDFH